MMDLKDIRNVIFDCDGVIFDSNALKTVAFEHTLDDHSINKTDIDAFIRYHQKYGGVSRYVKLKYLITNILQIPFDDLFYQSLLSVYAQKSLESYFEAEFTDGCLSFLEVLIKSNITLYIASGSDENELNIAFKKRNIAQHFKAIYGSPKTKREIVKNYILPESKVSDTIFIGDAPGDMEVAMENGMNAIAIIKYSENKKGLLEKAVQYGFTSVDSLQSLLQ